MASEGATSRRFIRENRKVIDAHNLLIVFTAYIIGAASPGPSNMRIMDVAMNQYRRSTLSLAAGVISGSFFLGILAATGVSAVLTQYSQALVVLKVAGVIYLLFLAIKAGRSALTAVERLAQQVAAVPSVTDFMLYQRDF